MEKLDRGFDQVHTLAAQAVERQDVSILEDCGWADSTEHDEYLRLTALEERAQAIKEGTIHFVELISWKWKKVTLEDMEKSGAVSQSANFAIEFVLKDEPLEQYTLQRSWPPRLRFQGAGHQKAHKMFEFLMQHRLISDLKARLDELSIARKLTIQKVVLEDVERELELIQIKSWERKKVSEQERYISDALSPRSSWTVGQSTRISGIRDLLEYRRELSPEELSRLDSGAKAQIGSRLRERRSKLLRLIERSCATNDEKEYLNFVVEDVFGLHLGRI